MADVALGNIIVDGVVAKLTARLIDDVSDDTKASVVRAGKLQADPTKGTGINVLVWPSDDQNPDELYTNDKQEGITSPTFEIGGGSYYMRRFRIYMLFHFKGYQGDAGRTQARENSQVMLARIKQRILQMNSSDITTPSDLPKHPTTNQPQDDFGETVITVKVDEFFLKEGGGPGHYIWKGELDFSFLTEQLL